MPLAGGCQPSSPVKIKSCAFPRAFSYQHPRTIRDPLLMKNPRSGHAESAT